MSEVVRMPVRIGKDLKEKLEKLAEENNTSLNSLAIDLFNKVLEKKNDTTKTTEKINNENLEILQDKVNYLMQKVEHLKTEMQKEILEDFKIFANVLAKKIKQINTNYLAIRKPIKPETAKDFAEANKKPFVRKGDLIAAIDVYTETAELKIYKILEANTYTNIKAKNIENENEVVKIDLTNKVHFLSIVQIYRKI